MQYLLFSSRGFTLIELMIVITIIGILLSIGTVPYNYYMDRARVEQTADMIAQKWTLAHTDIRSGILFAPDKNANISIDFTLGSSMIPVYITTDSTFVTGLPLRESSTMKLSDTIVFPKNITILSMSGSLTPYRNKHLGYYIEAPFGSGGFFNGSSTPGFAPSGIILTIGYPNGSLSDYRAREIYLAPQSY